MTLWEAGGTAQRLGPAGTHEAIGRPTPVYGRRPRRVAAASPPSSLPRSKPISTVSDSVSPAPVSLFGDLCPGHPEGRVSGFPLGGAWPVMAGGGAGLLGAGRGFDFRGICNQWGAALATWWLWAILGGQRWGRGGVDLFKPPLNLCPFGGSRRDPGCMGWGRLPKAGASPTLWEPRINSADPDPSLGYPQIGEPAGGAGDLLT